MVDNEELDRLERRKLSAKKYYEKNRDKINAYYRDYRQKNKDKIRESNRKYYLNNKEKFKRKPKA